MLGVVPPEAAALGLAVDLGTTKIAARLVDLASGRTRASAGAPNPQVSYGEDVVSRLNFAMRSPRTRRLMAEKARQAIRSLLDDLLRQAGEQSAARLPKSASSATPP